MIGDMAKKSVLREKSYAFAVEMVAVYRHLSEQQREFVLSRQLLRAGTSIGANVEEAEGAQSKRDFLSKISISYKEARESCYWLRLLTDTKYLDPVKSQSLLEKAEELQRMMSSIIKTTKSNLEKERMTTSKVSPKNTTS